MTHVRIAFNNEGRGVLEIDGTDISRHVLAEGLEIDLSSLPPFRVSMVLAADTIEADLPEAVLDAIRQEEGE